MKVLRDDARGTANWIPMGGGKTISTLTAVADLINDLQVCRVLIAGPKRVIERVWTDEANAWAHTEHLRMSVIVGTPQKRLAALAKDADVHLINVEGLQWLESTLVKQKQLVLHGDRKRSPYDMIVLDESELAKNRASKRFKVLKRLSRLCERLVLLTGTPATEGLHNLWAQFNLIDDGKRLLPNYTSFLEMWFKNVGHPDWPTWRVKSKQAEQSIHSRIADVTHTLSDAELVQLPKENRIVRHIELEPAERKLYDKFAREAVLPLLDGSVITAASAAVLVGRLSQLAGGQIYDAERRVHVIHRRKLDELRVIVDEAQGKPLLVAIEFRHDQELIKRTFGAKSLDDGPSVMDEWNAGRIPVMTIHPRSAGHGLNLQYGGFNLIRYNLSYSLSLWLQLFARLQRPGQKSPYVNHILLLAKDTIDGEILKAIEAKRQGHEGLLNAMKQYAQNLA